MRKSRLLIRAFFRKSRDGVIIISAFVFLISLLSNLFFMLYFDYQKNFDRYHDRLNAEHNILIFSAGESASFCSDADRYFSGNGDVSDFESIGVLAVNGNCDYDSEKLETNFVGIRLSDAVNKRIGKYEILEEDSSVSGVLLPYIFYASGNYKTGDIFTIHAQTGDFTCAVRGFYVSAMNSSPNCVTVALLYTDDLYEEAVCALKSERIMYSIRLCDPSYSSAFLATVSNAVSEWRGAGNIVYDNCLADTKAGRYIVATICTAVVSGAAAVSLAVSVVLVAFHITGYIRDNITMFGTFKALGYRTKNTASPFAFLFFAVSLVCSVLGALASYAVFPFINRVLTAQVGLPYTVTFLAKPFIITVAALTLAVTLVAALTLTRIGAILPIHAIRRVKTKEHRHRLPLEKSKLPVNIALPVRYMLSNAGQNAIIAVTMAVVSLLSVFSIVILQNVLVNDTDLAYLVFGEFCDSSVLIPAEEKEELKLYLEKEECVENVLGYYLQDVSNGTEGTLVAKVIDDCANVTNRNYCYRGSLPQESNEAALGGKYAREHGYSIGDSITVSCKDKEKTFTVCGLVQGAETLGRDLVMTDSAFDLLSPRLYYRYYITLSAGTDIDAFNEAVKEAFPRCYAFNKISYLNSLENSYFSAIKAISAAVLLVSLCIVLFVLFVLTRSLLKRKKRDNGIMKALGYSSGRLVLQTVLTYLPITVFSVCLGTALSCYAVNPLLSLLLKSIGIERCAFEVPLSHIALCALFLMAASLIFIAALSSGIRKIIPHRLLSKE